MGQGVDQGMCQGMGQQGMGQSGHASGTGRPQALSGVATPSSPARSGGSPPAPGKWGRRRMVSGACLWLSSWAYLYRTPRTHP